METKILPGDDIRSLFLALDCIRSHQLVAFPTDTVYGLGAALDSSKAIKQLYLVKGREASKAIAVLVGDPADAEKASSSMNNMAKLFARHFWPGPLTLVVPRRPDLSEAISSVPTVGLRMPDHPLAIRLLRLTGPLAVTSANLSGAANSTTACEVYAQLAGRISLILDGGNTPGGMPSTVVDCTGRDPVILRQGPISFDQLNKVLRG